MKTFEELYNELQSTENSEMHTAWKEAKAESSKANRLSLIICLSVDLIAAIIILMTDIFVLALIVPIIMINLFVIIIVNATHNTKQSEFAYKYKSIVINKLMGNFYDNLKYYPDKEMPEHIYANLNYGYYNRYHSEDYFEAILDNKYSVQAAEILTQKVERYTDSQGRRRTRTYTIFSGLFSKIVMDKSINSELKIMKDGNFLFDKKLKMDSTNFEKYFDVKASNEIIGMQLLTSDVMEELIQFTKNTNIRFDINVKNNEIYLRFHCGNMFEAKNLKNGVLDKETLQKYFCTLNLTYNLSNKLIKTINNTQI